MSVFATLRRVYFAYCVRVRDLLLAGGLSQPIVASNSARPLHTLATRMNEPPSSDRGPSPDTGAQQPAPAALPPLVLSSEELFQGRRELMIEHGGEMYRLRITSRGRLILTK